MFNKKIKSLSAIISIVLPSCIYASCPPHEKPKGTFTPFLKEITKAAQKQKVTIGLVPKEELESSFYLPAKNSEQYDIYKSLVENSKTIQNIIADNPSLEKNGGMISLPALSKGQIDSLLELLKETNFEAIKLTQYLETNSLEQLIDLAYTANFLEINFLLQHTAAKIANHLNTLLISFNTIPEKLKQMLTIIPSSIQSPIMQALTSQMLQTYSKEKDLEEYWDGVNSIAFSPNGKFLSAGVPNGTVIIWDVAMNKIIKNLVGHNAEVTSVAYSPNGKFLASVSDDSTIIIWDLETNKPSKTLEGHTSLVKSIAYSPNGKQLASGSADGTTIIWDVETGNAQKKLSTDEDMVVFVTYNPNGKSLASVSASPSADYIITIWDTESGGPLKSFAGFKSIAYSPNGKLLASGSKLGNGNIIILDPEAGNRLKSLYRHASTVTSVVFNPNGRQLASASMDGSAIIWNLETDKPMQEFNFPVKSISSIAFSLDGKLFAVGSKYRRISIFQLNPIINNLSFEQLIIFLVAQKLYQENKINQFNPKLKKTFDAFPKEVKEIAEKKV